VKTACSTRGRNYRSPEGARNRSRLAMNTASESERSDIEDLLPGMRGTLDARDMQRVEPRSPATPSWRDATKCARGTRPDRLSQRNAGGALAAPLRHCSPRSMPSGAAADGVDKSRARIGNSSPVFRTHAGLVGKCSGARHHAASRIDCRHRAQGEERGSYETASAPTNVAGDGAYALIRFQPQANAADITNSWKPTNSVLRAALRGRTIRVRIAEIKLPQTDIARIVKTLQGISRRLHRHHRVINTRSSPCEATQEAAANPGQMLCGCF